MSEDFEVRSTAPAPKLAPGEPDTNPKARKPATVTPATTAQISQATEKRRESYAKEPGPEAPAATGKPVPDATPGSMPPDLRKSVLKACRAEARELAEAYRTFQERDEKISGILDHRMALRRRDALIEDINPENFETVMREWIFLAALAGNPDGIAVVRRLVENWRVREFESVEAAGRTFHKRITAEVERLKAQAAESERGFFEKLFGGTRRPKDSPAARLVTEGCECLTSPGSSWEEVLRSAKNTAGAEVVIPWLLIELAEEAVSLPE